MMTVDVSLHPRPPVARLSSETGGRLVSSSNQLLPHHSPIPRLDISHLLQLNGTGEVQRFQGPVSSTSSINSTAGPFMRSKGVQRSSTMVSQNYHSHSPIVNQGIHLSMPVLPAAVFPGLGDLHAHLHPHHLNYTPSEERIVSSNVLVPSPTSQSLTNTPRGGVTKSFPNPSLKKNISRSSLPSTVHPLFQLQQQQLKQPQAVDFHAMQELPCCPGSSVSISSSSVASSCPILSSGAGDVQPLRSQTSGALSPSRTSPSAKMSTCASSFAASSPSPLSGKSLENLLDCVEEQKQSCDDESVDVIPVAVYSVASPFSDEKGKGKSGTSPSSSEAAAVHPIIKTSTSRETSKKLQRMKPEEKSQCIYRDDDQRQQQQQQISNKTGLPVFQSVSNLHVQQQQPHWLPNTAAQQQQHPPPSQPNPYHTQMQHQYHRALVAQQRFLKHQQQCAMQFQCIRPSAKRSLMVPKQIVTHHNFPSVSLKSKESMSMMSQQQQQQQQQQQHRQQQQQQQQYPHFVPRKPNFINPYFLPVVQPSALQVPSYPLPTPPELQTSIQHQNVPYVDNRHLSRHPTPSSCTVANPRLITPHHVKRRILITDGNEPSSSLPPPHHLASSSSKKSSSSSSFDVNATTSFNTPNLKSITRERASRHNTSISSTAISSVNNNSANRSRSSANGTSSSSSNQLLEDGCGSKGKASRSSSNPASRHESRRIKSKANTARRTKSQKSKSEMLLDSSSPPITSSLMTMKKGTKTSVPTTTANSRNNNIDEKGKREKGEEMNARNDAMVYRTQHEDETIKDSREKEWTTMPLQHKEELDTNLRNSSNSEEEQKKSESSSSSSGKEKNGEGVSGTIQATVNLYRMNSITGEVDVRSVPMISIHEDPEIFILPGFLSQEECDHICELCEMQTWERSRTSKGGQSYPQWTYKDLVSPIRTSCSVRITTAETPIIRAIEQRVAAVTKMPVEYVEPFVVVRYEVGEFFKEHHDGEFRPATFLLYLNDVEEGGETEFPYLGFRIRPERGTGIYWKNLDSSGKANQLMNHAGLPPLRGLKYVVNCFINKDPVGEISSESVKVEEKKENEKEKEQEIRNSEKRVETPLLPSCVNPKEERVGSSSLQSLSPTCSQSSNVSWGVNPTNLQSIQFPSSLSSVSLSSTSSSSSVSVPSLPFSSSSAAPLFSNPSFFMLPGQNGGPPQLVPLFSTSGGVEQQKGGGGGVGAMTYGKENEPHPMMSSIINMMMGSMSKMMSKSATSTTTSTTTTQAESTKTSSELTSSLISTNSSSSPSTSHSLTPSVSSLPHQHMQSRPYSVSFHSPTPKGLAAIQECEYEGDARLSSGGSSNLSTSPPVLLCARKEMSTRMGGEGEKGRTR